MVADARKFRTTAVACPPVVLGEVHLPLYLRGVWLVFGDHRLMRMKRGIYCSKDFEPSPQYGGWIGDRGAVGDARTTNMTSLRLEEVLGNCWRLFKLLY